MSGMKPPHARARRPASRLPWVFAAAVEIADARGDAAGIPCEVYYLVVEVHACGIHRFSPPLEDRLQPDLRKVGLPQGLAAFQSRFVWASPQHSICAMGLPKSGSGPASRYQPMARMFSSGVPFA
jgi:hypothetical protein